MAVNNYQESTNESGSNSTSFNGISPFKQDSPTAVGNFHIGNFNRGRGSFNRGRGSFNRGRGNFNRGRGNFNRGRGDFSNGRGNFNRGRGYQRDNSFPRSPRGHYDHGNKSSTFKGYIRENESGESFSKRRRTDFPAVSEKLSELMEYYKQILIALQHGVEDDNKTIFIMKALEVSVGEEVALCSDGLSGRCIVSLLNHCKDNITWMRFMTAFASEKQSVVSNPFTSHIMELFISRAMRSLQNWEEILESQEDSENKEFPSFCLSWLNEFGDFVMESLSSIAENRCSNHVMCSLLCAFAGDMSELSKLMSKKYTNEERNFHDIKDKSETLQPVVLTNVPKVLLKKLKSISKVLLNENVKEFLRNDLSDIAVEALLFALKKRWPNCFKQFVLRFSSTIFKERNSNGVPVAFLDKVYFFTILAILRSSDEELHQELWETYFSKCLEQLICHENGRTLLQMLFDTVESKAQFQVMINETMPHFKHVLSFRNYGLFRAIAAACNRHSAQQAQFTQSMLQCLNCIEPEQQKEMVPLILSFKPFGTPDSEIKVCHDGSYLMQLMLKFQKPKKLVESILNLKPAEISNLVMDPIGCYVFHGYFGNESVGEEDKDKLVELMKSSLPHMITDEIGSKTLCKIWLLLSIKNRSAIIESLIQEKSTLMSNDNAKEAMKQFGVLLFTNDYEKWKVIQKNLHTSWISKSE